MNLARTAFILFFSFWVAGFTSGQTIQLKLENTPVSLEKNAWMLYYGKTFEEVKQSPGITGQAAIVPGSWGKLGFPEKGYGTFICRFSHNLGAGEALAFKILTVGTTYEVYIDGVKKGAAGVFGKTEDASRPDFKPDLFYFTPNSDTVEIAIQVSNFNYREGGIWFTPTVGKADVMSFDHNFQIFIDAFLFGSLFVLFCYCIAFYYIKTRDKSSLYFALLCIFGAFRIISTGDILIRQLDIPIPWGIIVRMEYISLALMILFGVIYLNSLFTKDVNQKMVKGIIYFNIVLISFFVVTPIYISSYVIPYYLFYCLFVLLYLLNLVIKVILYRRPYANWVGGAYLLVFSAGINDIFYSQGMINSFYLMPAGIFVFSIVQALTLTRMFSAAFRDVEKLSSRLKDINRNQKEIIQERTSLLNLQAKELQESNLIKDKVFSIIAHDLRAPIKSLSTVLTWVADDDLTFDELKKSLSSISKNVDTLNLTLENLLQWSRSQLNGVKSEPELIDLRKPVQEILELYKIQTAEKGIVLKSTLTERMTVFIDKHHLHLLFRNLVSNAIKFTRAGGVIEISGEVIDSNTTRIIISDTGVGMSAEVVNKVFSPVDHYTTFGTNNEKGTGLGLLLCKDYIEKGNGTIRIESEEGKGTKVVMDLPSNG